ncbi:hypothetical protein SlGVgp068 [Spodoptera litura granulovirus]|uniref:Chitin-binding type-2 domain-containing protein n=1 Tax=Spodoptera litura granulovirus TaxID=359919 RepID=A5IZS0_9BBAC|nr:hypothetical protein SlGVgp068 [Spodoptera litura granulovirus]ABQ52011.1 hypothetical protein SlGVgp068 [Spodoptera litura granulovirus]
MITEIMIVVFIVLIGLMLVVNSNDPNRCRRPDPTNCRKFYDCDDNLVTCPITERFDDNTLTCRSYYLVDCGDRYNEPFPPD